MSVSRVVRRVIRLWYWWSLSRWFFMSRIALKGVSIGGGNGKGGQTYPGQRFCGLRVCCPWLWCLVMLLR